MTDTEKPTGTRGVAYVRVSTGNQADGRKSQRESVERWLAQRGLAVADWYEDVGSRDLAHKRPDFQRLLRDVSAGAIDWIVVDAKDRFGTANAWEFGKFVCQLREHDCQLWSALQGHLTADDAVTEILATVDSVRSRDEQVNKAARAIRGKIAGIKRGEWQGGFCPFGYDVVCYGPDGREKWRCYYTGTHERLKLYPDGRAPERFDGPNNFPKKDEHDALRLAPSSNQERVEVARRIFRWFATESVTLRGLATRLNALGVHPVNGEAWYSARIGPLLRNPVYVTGMTVWNKKGHGRFLEYRDGQYREVERRKGRARTGRPRAEADLVFPQGEFTGLIDRPTWEAVQAKLRGVHRSAKAPRNPRLWLAQLLHCGHCGTRMAGWSQKSGGGTALAYTCNTYRKYGRHNRTGCQLHRLRGEVAEGLVERYLAETGQKLDLLAGAGAEGRLLAALRGGAAAKAVELLRTAEGIRRFVTEECGVEVEVEIGGRTYETVDARRAYRPLFDRKRREDEGLLAAKEAELAGLVRLSARLTSALAVAEADRQAAAVAAEIEGIRGRLRPLDEKLAELRAGLAGCRDAVRAAREALRGDAERQKAQALSGVVARIVCHFRHDTAGPTRQARSVLTRVEFEPLAGRPWVVTPAADVRGGNPEGRG